MNGFLVILFPYGYQNYDYLFVTGKIKLRDGQYFEKMVLIDTIGIWRVYFPKNSSFIFAKISESSWSSSK